MRLAALFAASILLTAPAMAQRKSCEADASGKYGDVIYVYMDLTARIESKFYWYVERTEGVGEEHDNFARPRLQLTFHFDANGAVTGPASASVSITRYSDSQVGAAPPLSAVTVQAKLPDGQTISWNAAQDEGAQRLADRLKAKWLPSLTLDLLMDGKMIASASFDLGLLDAAIAAAREAQPRCGA